jgi:hypothetical protein
MISCSSSDSGVSETEKRIERNKTQQTSTTWKDKLVKLENDFRKVDIDDVDLSK